MCFSDGDPEPGQGLGLVAPHHLAPAATRIGSVEELMRTARGLVKTPEFRRTASGFVGYGATRPGHRVLVAVDNLYDSLVVEAVTRAFREAGAKVDLLILDVGEDRELDELDEIRAIMRRRPWSEEPRRYEGVPWVEELAGKMGYDLLVHGKGGGIPKTPHRYEAMPWLSRETFSSPATLYPVELHKLINERSWHIIWSEARGGKVRVTDPEGTDVTFTLWDDYYEHFERNPTPAFGSTPWWGHLMGHPPPPILQKEDASGVIAGTTSHLTRPFPRIRLYLEKGKLVKIEGGGKYGEAWRQMLEETENIRYPEFPGKGLFWLWEMAIGTNPKIHRPRNVLRLSGGGMEWERRRSGVIHVGIGTRWRGDAEKWAGEHGFLYGHLHVHLLFPTYQITKDGRSWTVIEGGRLRALDDPEIREVAKKYGDPDQLLRDDWQPLIPGVNALGDYGEFAGDPATAILEQLKSI